VPVTITDAKDSNFLVDAHPKNESVGKRNVWTSKKVYVEEEDAALFKEGENVTFINWGNIKINSVQKKDGKVVSISGTTNLDDTDFKKTMKVTWLAEVNGKNFTPVKAIYYDHIITKPVLAPDEDFKQYVGKNTKVCVER